MKAAKIVGSLRMGLGGLASLLASAAPAATAPSPTVTYATTIADIAKKADAAGFNQVTIRKGSQYATWPSWLSFKPELRYAFSFDPSAIYQHPDKDQFDWNKLPGVSDCGTLDLQVHGGMFAWRWVPETRKLQITAYANRNSVHQAWNMPNWQFKDQVQLVELDESDLMQFAPLTYEIKLEPLIYRFSIQGVLPSGRMVSSTSTLPRSCSKHPLFKHGSTLYFGGTKTAPHKVTGHVKWIKR